MFTSVVFATVLASSNILLSHAIVTPNAPGPGDVFKQGGGTCHIGWAGDTASKTDWKNMAIELMTGNNFPMTHVTTVAQNQDGTVDGVFDYPCPSVTPNSQIYFYQFSSANTKNQTWTGRFTIAAADGSTTPPTESGTDGNGQPFHWGNGALVDPSTAIPPPTFDSTSGSSSAGSSAAPGGSSASSPSSPASPPASQPSNPASGSSGSSSKSAGSPSPVSSQSSGNSSSTAGAPKTSVSGAAMAVAPVDLRMWPAVSALIACAMGFMILL